MDSGTEIIVAVIGSITTITAALISFFASRRPEPKPAPAVAPPAAGAAPVGYYPAQPGTGRPPAQPTPGYPVQPVGGYPQQPYPYQQAGGQVNPPVGGNPPLAYPGQGGYLAQPGVVYQPAQRVGGQPVGVQQVGVQPVGAGGAVARVLGALLALLLALYAFFLISDFIYEATTEPDQVTGKGVVLLVVAVVAMLVMLNLGRVLIRRVGKPGNSWRRPLVVSVLIGTYGLTLLALMLSIQQS